MSQVVQAPLLTLDGILHVVHPRITSPPPSFDATFLKWLAGTHL